ncbi:MAG: energy transducer TonB [Gammaproteobacteria bacterium]
MRRIITLACSTLLIACTGTAVGPVSTAALSDGDPKLLNPRQINVGVPRDALLRGISGDVLLQYRLDDKGKPQDIRVVLAEPKGVFEKHSIHLLSKMRYSLPPQWIADHPKRIREIAFVYMVNRCPPKDPFPGIAIVLMDSWLNSPEVDKVREACEERPAS